MSRPMETGSVAKGRVSGRSWSVNVNKAYETERVESRVKAKCPRCIG